LDDFLLVILKLPMISTTPSLNKLSDPEYEAGKKRFLRGSKGKRHAPGACLLIWNNKSYK
jgi:hypothetical protein